MTAPAREQLEQGLKSGLAAVHAGRAVARYLRRTQAGEIRIADRALSAESGIWVLALGKAAPNMLAEVETAVGDRIRGGLAVAPDGHFAEAPRTIAARAAGHPIPDQRSERAALDLLSLVRAIPSEDVLLLLLSGGTSALTTCPASGLKLADLEETNRLLLASGAEIGEVNAVRKHCSCFSGGRLAAASGTRKIEVLAISDVVGDRPDVIGSGPCSPDPTTFADALEVVNRFGLDGRIPTRVMEHLDRGVQGQRQESPAPGDPSLQGASYRIIAANVDARQAACEAGRRLGLRALDLGEVLGGEARVAGTRLAGLAQSLRSAHPTLLVAGGETVVRVTGQGRGGRNQELALAAALTWAESGAPGVSLLAAGTDGRDGPTDVAGAFADGRTVVAAA
ncbi:MAG: DUF4147 domain-containing protein, partial [Myxococcota bacterium]